MKNNKIFLLLVPFLLVGCNKAPAKPSGEEHVHEFSSAYTYDETNHWHQAVCSHTDLTQGLEPHTFDSENKCVCGYKKEVTHTHTFSDEFNHDSNYHWKDSTCEHLGLAIEFAEHTFDQNNICTICKYEKVVVAETYTVRFNTLCEDIIEPLVVEKDETISNLPTPTKPDYTFLGWFTNPNFTGDEFTSETPVNENITLFAKYEVKEYEIKFWLDGGNWPNGNSGSYTVKTKCGEIPVPPGTPHKGSYEIGHHFVGWKSSVDGEMGLKVVHEHEGEIMYTAIYGDPYYVAFKVDFHDFSGNIYKTVMVPYAYPLEVFPENPTVPSTIKHSYFTNWTEGKVGGEEIKYGDHILGNYQLYPNLATYDSHTMTVKVGTNGGNGRGKINGTTENLTFTIYEDSEIFVVPGLYTAKGQLKVDGEVLVEAIPQEGTAEFNYWFGGWRIEGGADWYVNQTYKITNDISLIAIFGRNTNSYRVTWNVNGEDASSDLWDYGDTPSYDGDTPTKEGYVFTGWLPEVGKVTTNITYTAQFREKEFDYTIQEESKIVTITGPGDFKDDKVITVPYKIDKYEVSIIAADAFKNCQYLEFVDVEAFLYKVETNAFNSCPNLIEVRFSDSYVTMQRIKQGYVFIDNTCVTACPKLSSLVFPDGVIVTGETDPRTVGATAYSSISGKYEFVYKSDSTLRKCLVLGNQYPYDPDEGLYVSMGTGANCFKEAPYEHIAMPYTYDFIYATFVECPNLKTIVLSEYCWDLPTGFANQCPQLSIIYFGGTMETFKRNGDLSTIFVDCPNLSKVICSDGTIDLTK